MRSLWRLVGSYTLGGGQRAYYVLDEVGSRLGYAPEGEALCGCAVFVDAGTALAYTVFWPVGDLREGQALTCAGVGGGRAARLAGIGVLAGMDDDEEGGGCLEGIGAIRASLQEGGYALDGVSGLLGLAHLGQLLPAWDVSTPANRAAFEGRARAGGALGVLVRALLLGCEVEGGELRGALGEQAYEAMRALGMLLEVRGWEGGVMPSFMTKAAVIYTRQQCDVMPPH
jgi:hypothetical protein